MNVKMVRTEWYQDYKLPSMFIATNHCSFKCEKECGVSCCHNSSLAKANTIRINTRKTIEKYLSNPITSAIIFGGLEPMDQFNDIDFFIRVLRCNYRCDDLVIIYTGFNKDEINEQVNKLREYPNIIIKFGRFIPGQKKHFDEVLGVDLASPNQYAEKIS